MADLLSIGASGVRAYQSALTTVSENIAGAGVTGYVRRSTTLEEIGTAGGAARALNGMGVIASGVRRASDNYLQASVRSAGSDVARTQGGIMWLDGVQSALTGDRLSERMTSFFAAGTALSAEPSSSALRAAMLGTASSVALAFTATGAALDRTAADLDQRTSEAVTQINTLAQTLYKVNQGLGRSQPGTSAAAQLADQRDQLLEEMSALVDVNVTLDSVGRATVRAGGASGPVIADPLGASTTGFARQDGTLALSVARGDEIIALVPGGGALAGMIDGAQRIAAARDDLNALATSFTTTVNRIQQEGDDLAGNPGQPMFAVGATPTDITLAIEDGNAIAAASRGGGPRDASNLFALADSRSADGFENRINQQVSDNAARLNQRQMIADTQNVIRDGAITARAGVSGVNLDAEAVDLLRFQQAYQASSRVIQVARETFQSLLDVV